MEQAAVWLKRQSLFLFGVALAGIGLWLLLPIGYLLFNNMRINISDRIGAIQAYSAVVLIFVTILSITRSDRQIEKSQMQLDAARIQTESIKEQVIIGRQQAESSNKQAAIAKRLLSIESSHNLIMQLDMTEQAVKVANLSRSAVYVYKNWMTISYEDKVSVVESEFGYLGVLTSEKTDLLYFAHFAHYFNEVDKNPDSKLRIKLAFTYKYSSTGDSTYLKVYTYQRRPQYNSTELGANRTFAKFSLEVFTMEDEDGNEYDLLERTV